MGLRPDESDLVEHCDGEIDPEPSPRTPEGELEAPEELPDFDLEAALEQELNLMSGEENVVGGGGDDPAPPQPPPLPPPLPPPSPPREHDPGLGAHLFSHTTSHLQDSSGPIRGVSSLRPASTGMRSVALSESLRLHNR
jgi:hypothetical protein